MTSTRLSLPLLALLVGCSAPEEPRAGAASGAPVPSAEPGAASSGDDLDASDPVGAGGSIVLVHSWTGATAAAGGAIGAMLGAPVHRVASPPRLGGAPLEPDPGGALPAPLPAGARRVFLAFPIWMGGAPESIEAWLGDADLQGALVIPVATYLHYAHAPQLEALAEAIRAAGGRPADPILLRLPQAATDGSRRLAAERALLRRPDLWPSPPGRPRPDCRPAPAAREGRVCAVPAGPTWLGHVPTSTPPAGYTPPQWTEVEGFAMDEGEVTQRDWARCQGAGACDAPMPLCGFLGDAPEQAVACVDFDQARAFCEWAGMRLPTEAEWTRAARGASAQIYPWGDGPPGEEVLANLGEPPSRGLEEYALLEDTGWPDDGSPGLAPPCSTPEGRGPFGHCDLVGNVAEWVRSDGDPSAAQQRLKGGSWMEIEPDALRIGAAALTSRRAGFYLNGVRCAVDL